MRILLPIITFNVFFIIFGLTACTTESKKNLEYPDINIKNMKMEKAEIVRIVDGDTLIVRYFGDKKNTRIRILGIQAMEVHPYLPETKNDCWADDATRRIRELTGGRGNVVGLFAKDTSVEIRDRLARHVFIYDAGKNINVAKTLIKEGLVFPFPHRTENTYNKTYTIMAKKAKLLGLGLWAKDNYCKTSADSEGTTFKLSVHFDARGNDVNNLRGEWVKIKNTSKESVNISHWWLRDSALNFFRFPSDTIVDEDEEIIVYGGDGENDDGKFYWGNKTPIFDNFGDSVYLVDYLYDVESEVKGNIKGSFLY